MIGIEKIGKNLGNLKLGTVGAILAGVGLVVGLASIVLGSKNSDDPDNFVETTEPEVVEATDNLELVDTEVAAEE